MTLPSFPSYQFSVDLKLGDHWCLPVASDAERYAGTVWLTRQGLRSGGKVMVFTETETPGEMVALLTTRVPGAGKALASGQLEVQPCRWLYFPDGVFDPERMMAAAADQIDDAQRQGYPGLWAAVDMAWSLLDMPGADLLLDYEATVNNAFVTGRVAAGCIYDRNRFSPNLIEGVCSAHPLTPGQAPLRFTKTTSPPGLALTGELDLTNRGALAALMASLHSIPGDLTIDATGLQFIDLRSADLLYEVSVARGQGTSTTIVGSPVFDRLLELVAYSRSAAGECPDA